MPLDFSWEALEAARERDRKCPKMWRLCCVMNATAGHFLQTWLLLTHPKVSVREFKLLSMRGHPIAEEFELAVQKAIIDTIPFDDYKALRRITG